MALKLARWRRDRDPTGTMTMWEHLDELRTRLIISLGAIALGMLGGWFLFQPVFNIMQRPFCDFITAHPELAPNPSDPCRLVYLSVTEPFVIKLKVVAFLGIALALPILLYQLWRFITPGLTDRERKYSIPFVLSSLVLFTLGGFFAMLTLPKALSFLLGFAGTSNVVAVLSISKYLGFVMLVILAFGAAFEFPLVLISLTIVGVLSSRQLRQWRRYALVLIAVLAAVITPSADWFTMAALMVPLLIFYELSILIARILKK
jgi:sec-independent protein translocase protein TatC